ncbi:hypothetical protein GCM10010326_16650 [Streptomyces xanthochromogenes]|uniref:Uncharacterized protein n=1 Tax=Streptomyces xanthochromogenes TaxID=67384 RepID=A0ABQ2ZV65_9ACTN|nr:hypothetical protein GCM10010326_16650 [Streptomyces xanthochromogenes]
MGAAGPCALPRAPNPLFGRGPRVADRAVPRAPNPVLGCGPRSLFAQFPAPLETRSRPRTVVASRAVPRAPEPAFVRGPQGPFAQFLAPLAVPVRGTYSLSGV